MSHSNNKTENYTDFFYYTFRNILIVSIPLVIISALILGFNVPHSSAENSSADGVSISIPSTCTMASNIVSPHTASMIGGTQTEVDSEGIGMGTTELDTVCNDKDGYLIYAKGITQNSNNEVILSSTIGSEYDIKTGTGTMSDNRSSWGMKLIPVSGSNQYPPDIVSTYTNFTSVPSNWTKVASKSSATSSITHSKLKTTYSIYITTEQPAGTYSGQVKYVMLHPSTATVVPTNTLESAFAAAGKSKKTGVADPVTGQTGSFYRMQDMNSSICEAVAPNDNPGYDEIQLVDDRDNKIYWVAKLKDGHCWMTQNLDLDLTSGVALTSETTDLNDNSLNGAYQAGYSYDAANRIISWSPTNTTRDYQHSTGTPWGNNLKVAYSLDPGEWYWDGDDSTANCGGYFTAAACKDHFTGFTSSDPTSARDNVNKHLSVGNYYNWSAAIASNGSGSLTTSTYSNIAKNPQNSICPKGWRLPTISNMAYTTANSTSEFGRLNQLYNGGGSTDPKLISNPLWFVRSGGITYGSFNNSGSDARYWSSTVYNSDGAYYLNFAATSVNPANYYHNGYSRNHGWSVRCLAK